MNIVAPASIVVNAPQSRYRSHSKAPASLQKKACKNGGAHVANGKLGPIITYRAQSSANKLARVGWQRSRSPGNCRKPDTRLMAKVLGFAVHVCQMHDVIHRVSDDDDTRDGFACSARTRPETERRWDKHVASILNPWARRLCPDPSPWHSCRSRARKEPANHTKS